MSPLRFTAPLCALLLAPAALAQTSWDVTTASNSMRIQRMDEFGHRASVLRPGWSRPPLAQASGAKALVGDGWEALGPFGGDVDDVGMSPTNPSVVLAALAPSTSGGTMYRSTDNGLTWTELSAFSGLDVHVIEFAADGTAFAGTLDSVWRSTDDGATWMQLNLGIGANDQVFEIALESGSSSNLWVGVAGALGSQAKNTLRSTDGGATWTDRTPAGASGSGCTGIAFDPSNPSQVFAVFAGGFGGGSAWSSANGGASWTNISSGLPGNPLNDVTYDGTRLLAAGGLLFGSQFVGLYESLNMGASWSAVHDASWPSLVINDIEIDSSSPNLIYLASAGSGVFRSSDAGATWIFNMSGTAGMSVNSVEVSPLGSVPIFSGSSSTAVSRSINGVDFSGSSVGIGSLNVETVRANPTNPNELLAAFQGLNDGGAYSSLDGGLSWTLEALPGTRYNASGFAPDGTAFVLSDGPTTIAAEALYRRSGATWTSIGPNQGPLFESELFAMDFGVADPQHIVLGGSDFGVAGFEMTLWLSSDGGATWTKTFEGLDNEDVRDVRILKDGSNLNVVASYTDSSAAQDGGAFRSSDGGASWISSSAGLGAGAQGYGLGLSASNPGTVYLADGDVGAGVGGVFRSTDSGATWTSTGYVGIAREVSEDPLVPGRLYITQFNAPKVLVSNDSGATFAPFDSGVPSNATVRDLVLLEGPCNTLLLSTSLGVYSEGASCQFEADVDTLSLSAGGTQNWTVNAGPSFGNALYWILGTVSGTTPGFAIDGQTLPLNPDSWFLNSLSLANSFPYTNSLGTLDANGQMTNASLGFPSAFLPGLAGLTFHHAAAIFTVGGPSAQVVLATNAQPLTLTP